MFTSPIRSRAWTIALVAGLVGWTALAASLDNGHFGLFQDDGLYLTSARSLRDGRGFGLPSRPGEPPPKYPIGLPAAVALVLALDPGPASLAREVGIARALVLASGWAFFLAAFAWLRRLGVGPGMACGVVLATAYHHVVLVGGAATLFSDLPFAAVTFGLLARWAGRGGAKAEGAGRRAFVDGLIAGAAVLLRTNGVTLAFAALVAAGSGPRRRSSLLACLAGLVIAAAPATLYAGRHPRVVPSNSYLLELKAGWSSPSAGLAILASNARSMALDFPTRVLASPTAFVAPVVRALAAHPRAGLALRVSIGLVVALGVIGLARSSRRVDASAWAHAAGSAAIFAAWPWGGIMDRFLLGLMPMVALAFARGLERSAALMGMGPVAGRRLAAAGLAVALLGNSAVAIRAASVFHANARQWPGAPDRASLGRALALIRDRTDPDAVVAAPWPELVHLHTGRTVVPLIEDEAVLVDRYGDAARLELWRAQVPGRPFYLLHRGEAEDPRGADRAQVEALEVRSGLAAVEVARTPDGRYRLSRLGGPGGVGVAAR